MWGKRPIDWITYPMPLLSAMTSHSLVSFSFSRIVPEVGSMSRLIIFRSVVFPHPLVPRRQSVSPCSTENVTSFTA